MRALFIDFDGTLTNDRYWRSLPQDENNIVQKLLFGDDRTIVYEWMRGGYTAEEVNEIAAKALGIPYEELWKLFVSDCQTMSVSEELMELLTSLKEKYTTVLITGNMDSFTRFTVPALNLDECFHYISNSYYEKIHKTDNKGELFRRWSDKLGIPLEKAILVDDQNKCCDTFERLSGKAYKTNSLDNTINILKSL